MALHLSVSKLLRFGVIPLKPLHNTAVGFTVMVLEFKLVETMSDILHVVVMCLKQLLRRKLPGGIKNRIKILG